MAVPKFVRKIFFCRFPIVRGGQDRAEPITWFIALLDHRMDEIDLDLSLCGPSTKKRADPTQLNGESQSTCALIQYTEAMANIITLTTCPGTVSKLLVALGRFKPRIASRVKSLGFAGKICCSAAAINMAWEFPNLSHFLVDCSHAEQCRWSIKLDLYRPLPSYLKSFAAPAVRMSVINNILTSDSSLSHLSIKGPYVDETMPTVESLRLSPGSFHDNFSDSLCLRFPNLTSLHIGTKRNCSWNVRPRSILLDQLCHLTFLVLDIRIATDGLINRVSLPTSLQQLSLAAYLVPYFVEETVLPNLVRLRLLVFRLLDIDPKPNKTLFALAPNLETLQVTGQAIVLQDLFPAETLATDLARLKCIDGDILAAFPEYWHAFANTATHITPCTTPVSLNDKNMQYHAHVLPQFKSYSLPNGVSDALHPLFASASQIKLTSLTPFDWDILAPRQSCLTSLFLSLSYQSMEDADLSGLTCLVSLFLRCHKMDEDPIETIYSVKRMVDSISSKALSDISVGFTNQNTLNARLCNRDVEKVRRASPCIQKLLQKHSRLEYISLGVPVVGIDDLDLPTLRVKRPLSLNAILWRGKQDSFCNQHFERLEEAVESNMIDLSLRIMQAAWVSEDGRTTCLDTIPDAVSQLQSHPIDISITFAQTPTFNKWVVGVSTFNSRGHNIQLREIHLEYRLQYCGK